MNTKVLTLGSMTAIAVLLSLFVFADDDRKWSFGGPDLAPVANSEYGSECGACHFAYQPGLLPARSWEALMAGLDSHFGENAELGAEARGRITGYLTEHAADGASAWLSKKVASSIGATEAPLRISELPAVAREHHEIPVRVYRNNPDVGSLSNCSACHLRAEVGLYDEHTVMIPGYGEWDD